MFVWRLAGRQIKPSMMCEQSKSGSISLAWLRRDLRLRDQQSFKGALQSQYLVPLYVFDKEQMKPRFPELVSIPKLGPHRAKATIQALKGLKKQLHDVGSDLVVKVGDTKEEVVKMLQLVQPYAQKIILHFQMDILEESFELEDSVINACRTFAHQHSLEFEAQPYWDLTLFHPDDLPYQEFSQRSGQYLNKNKLISLEKTRINKAAEKFFVFPDTMTKFRDMTLNIVDVRDSIDAPLTLPAFPPIEDVEYRIPSSVDELFKQLGATDAAQLLTKLCDWDKNMDTAHITSFPFQVDEVSACKRLKEYLWGHEGGDYILNRPSFVHYFKETRMQAVGVDNSSKLSAFMALGCISPRMVYEEVQKVNDTLKHSKGELQQENCQWLIMHLCIRDFFIFTALKGRGQILTEEGMKGEAVTWERDVDVFSKWCQGRTGLPFVDACMRELVHTGYISNRGRQNVASFLTKELQIDWRLGAALFECLLVDHDVGVNYSNWNYFAGIGNDPRNRRFKTVTQGMQYDEEAELIRRWIPILQDLSPEFRHQPWLLNYQIDYPDPMVEVQSQMGVGKKQQK